MNRNLSLFPMIGGRDINLAAQLFRAERLTLARELRGLTKAELAERISKTPSAISQFEADRARPDASTVGELALALGVPASFFTLDLKQGPMQVDACHFRSLRSASQKDRRRLLAAGSLLCELADILEDYVELPSGEQIPRARQRVFDDEEIEAEAGRVRQEWGLGLGPISNVVKLMENKGIIVSYIPEACAEVDAFSGWRKNHPFVFLTASKDAPSRSRFDAMHELGHLIMHADAQPGNPEIEQQANLFASAFLMPRESFSREAPRRLDWPLIWELKRRWKVSAAALIRRSRDLGILSEASYKRAFIHLNEIARTEDGRRLPEIDEPAREEPGLLTRSVTLVADEVSLKDLAEFMGLRTNDVESLLNPLGRQSHTDI